MVSLGPSQVRKHHRPHVQKLNLATKGDTVMPTRLTWWMMRQVWFVCLSILTASCYYLPPEIVPVHPETPPSKFFGITELTPAPDSNRIRILFVHGIGVHPGCDPDTLLLHLTKALQVVQLPPPAIDRSETCPHFLLPMPTPIPAPNAQNTGLLYRFDLAGRDRQATFMYLRWSTLTSGPKMTLDEPNRPPGALLHNLAKQFEQENLADVVLYGGQYRDVLRPVVERALCVFVGGTPDQTNPRACIGGEANIPTAIITHSLGGYMLMDAMSDIYHPPTTEAVSEERNAAVKVGRYLDQIFMLANQLKMLDLSTRTSEVQAPQIVRRFGATWEAVHSPRRRTARELSSRQVLAISDPNDILSWEVTKDEFEIPRVTVANVYLGTAGQFFGLPHLPIWPLAASPVAAHTNYLQDDDVMDIIVCGMNGSTINRCTQ